MSIRNWKKILCTYLRAADWKERVDINTILDEDVEDDESPEHVVKVSHAIANLLSKKFPSLLDSDNEKYDSDLADIVEFLQQVDVEDHSDRYPLVDEFNYQLEKLYDWADDNSVWLG